MELYRNLLWLIIGTMSLFLFFGCGDIEPGMQDTRSVVLKMNFNQRSSARSSQISQTEVSSHKTHLILALPAWEQLSSSYLNYYNGFFAADLMNSYDNKVSLEIPLNTQMKIFTFLFRDEYTPDQLISGVGGVSYYGESQPFSIDKNTNNLRLNISLQSEGTSDGNDDVEDSTGGGNQGGADSTAPDTTAPTVSVIPDNITSAGFAVVQSTETGKVYLVNTDITVSNLDNIEDAADNQWNFIYINNANTDTSLSADGLVNGTYKAYAEDAAGNISAASLDNVTIVGLVDIDGNVYRTVEIGTQHWMAENLKVTKYRNGDNITHILKNSTVSYAWYNNTKGAYGYYNDIAENRDNYGMLYNWYAVDNSSSRYICPEGWHVPTDSEFSDLVEGLGSDPGAKLKEKGTVHWSSDPGTSNSSGFSALPAGNRIAYSGLDYNLGTNASFWTSSSNGSSAKYLYLRDVSSSIFSGGESSKKSGFSIRCLED